MTKDARLSESLSISPAGFRFLVFLKRRALCWVLLFLGGLIGCDSHVESKNNATKDSSKEQKTSNDLPSGSVAIDFSDLEVDTVDGDAPVHFARFDEVTDRSGIIFRYDNGASPQVLMVETTGGGCGWLDYDRDGKLDLYLVQGGNPTQAVSDSQPGNCLYRNVDGTQFVNKSSQSKTDDRHYGQGVSIGDFDNDGFDDIYVSNVGRDILYQNQGDATFRIVESFSADEIPSWSSSAAWGDPDRDGDLDLYVTSYAIYDPLNPKPCFRTSGEPGMCHPKEVEPAPDRFYENMGDGTFHNVAREWGLYGEGNRALGVAIADFNNDDWPDIYVANDTTENFLFVNEQEKGFQNQAQLLGCALNSNGSPQASMGIALGDYDRNGFLDLYLSHFHNEWNTLYQNLGEFGFHDVTAATQLAVPTMSKLGFGTAMEDFDHNGEEEIIVVNGHIDDVRKDGIDREMTSQYFSFSGTTWDDCTPLAGEFFEKKLIGRGLARADYDDDGDFDIAIVPQNSAAILLQNKTSGSSWLKIQLSSQTSNRQGIGSRVMLRSGEQTLIKELAGGTSYCSSHEPSLIFGLGEHSEPVDIEIRWPSGTVQKINNVSSNQKLRIQEPSP